MNRTAHRGAQIGLSLVELLIAVTIGLIILATVIGVFFASNRNYRENDALTSLQDNARFAMDTLSRDLAMAGYWGGVRPIDAARNVRVSTAAIASLTAGNPGDCGPATPPAIGNWLLNPATAIDFRDHLIATATSDFSRCLGNLQPNTDAVMIRRVSGWPALEQTAAGNFDLTAGRIYLKSNHTTGSLFRSSGSGMTLTGFADCADPDSGISITCPPVDVPVQFYAYVPHLYFIHKVAGDVTVPTLCRYFLRDDGTAPVMALDCLAEGVENLQLQWGLDVDDNGTVDQYKDTFEVGALSVRIHVLVRARDPQGAVSDAQKEFILGNYDSANDANFVRSGILRRTFTTTVQLKNFRTRQ